MKRKLNNRLKRLEWLLSIDKKPLTLSWAFELLEREMQEEKVDWDRYDTTQIGRILEGKK